MAKRKRKGSINLRYNMMTIVTYLVGIILIVQLFNLQIIHGEEYREQSNTRLTRESLLEAARGSIMDKTGNVLVSSKIQFNLALYKSKIDTQTLNESILNMVQVLEKYQVSYADSFPITIDPFTFKLEGDSLVSWKKSQKLEEDATPEQAFYRFKEKYKIEQEDNVSARKIMAIRYEIIQKGYSSTKSLTIATNIPREAVAEFSENGEKFPGISIDVQPVRQYTQTTLASHILGYASKIDPIEYEKRKDTYNQNDLIGKTGIEFVFEEYLKGKNGTKQIDMAVDGTTTAEYIAKEAVAGSDVVLTLDAKLQKVTEDALARNIQKIASGGFGKVYDTNSGCCVVMNVKTGEVLAMASYPNYSPEDFVGGISTENWNKYRDDTAKPLMDKAIQNSYSPGSIFKMVTAIAGLESGAITLTEKINDTGLYKKYGETWPCWYYTDYHRGHGWLNVSDAIKHSCNIFFYETGDRMGIETLDQYARYFGLGNKTGIELPSEANGVLASKEYAKSVGENWGPGQTINASIGQGYNEFTPLQMAKYISMIANGGKSVDVSIVKTIRNADGTEVSQKEIDEFVNQKLGLNQSETENLTIKQENLKAVLEGMRSVTGESGGTAYSIFKDFNIEVGGKTGSAEAGKKVNAWFAGFAPFNDPEIAVVVMVENGGHGNYTAEAVREIMREYFGMNTQNVEESITAMPYTEIIH